MTRQQDLAADLVIAAGLVADEVDVLPDALRELSVRLDLAGAGDLLTEITNKTCWGEVGRGHRRCPRCGYRLKGRPTPHPRGGRGCARTALVVLLAGLVSVAAVAVPVAQALT